jgi:hypothetical protein
MTWFKDGWADVDELTDEFCETLKRCKMPPRPLAHWLIDRDAVRNRAGDIYEDMLNHWPTERDKPMTDEQDAELRFQARRCAAVNVIDQLCVMLGVTLQELRDLQPGTKKK